MNTYDHKDLGNHLLQLCPKVVKHPVYSRTYECMHVRMHVSIYVCMYVSIHSDVDVCIHVQIRICVWIRVYLCMYICTCVCMYVYGYVCYVCMYVCTYVRPIYVMHAWIFLHTYVRERVNTDTANGRQTWFRKAIVRDTNNYLKIHDRFSHYISDNRQYLTYSGRPINSEAIGHPNRCAGRTFQQPAVLQFHSG
jgi:hypothetical protein